MCLHGSVVNPPVRARMKPQLYTNDFDIFQSNAFFGVDEESHFFKNMYVMVRINPHSEPLPRFEEGFQLCHCVVPYNIAILFWTANSDPRLKELVGERYNLNFPSGV